MTETCISQSWTLDSLNKHLSEQIASIRSGIRDQDNVNKERFQAAKEQVAMALTAADKAVSKAEMAAEKRFESVNEFRETLSDQATTLVSKAEYSSKHENVINTISDIKDRLTVIESRSQGVMLNKAENKDVWGYVIGLGGFALASVTLVVLLLKFLK